MFTPSLFSLPRGVPLSLGGWFSVLAPLPGHCSQPHAAHDAHLDVVFGSHLTVPRNLLHKFDQPRASSVLARLVQHCHLFA